MEQLTKVPVNSAFFYTGPVCAPGTTLQAPRLVYPPDNTTIDPSKGFPLRWDDPTGCLPDGDYYVILSTSPDFSSVAYADRRGHMSELWMYPSWAEGAAEDCTRYYWRVMADVTGPQKGPWSETWSFVVNKTGNACPFSALPPTPGPTPTPLPPTITPATPATPRPYLTAKMNVMCRRGPSSLDYPGNDVLFRSWSAWIKGRNPDSTWWYIHFPNNPGNYYCWVWGGAVEVFGDTSQVPIVKPPPPSTSTPEPTTPTPSG